MFIRYTVLSLIVVKIKIRYKEKYTKFANSRSQYAIRLRTVQGYRINSIEIMAADIETVDLTFECRKITAEEQQQEFCSYLGFQSETIIWDE